MRIPSLLSFAFVVALFSAGCTKDDLLPRTATGQVAPQTTYGVSYSDWTATSSFMWSANESGPMPFREATWEVPALTQELIDSGSVLIYARANKTSPVVALPFLHATESGSNEVDHFHADLQPGALHMTQARSIDGRYILPLEASASFRYIILTDITPAANGRPRTFTDLQAMSYEEVINVLGVPE